MQSIFNVLVLIYILTKEMSTIVSTVKKVVKTISDKVTERRIVNKIIEVNKDRENTVSEYFLLKSLIGVDDNGNEEIIFTIFNDEDSEPVTLSSLNINGSFDLETIGKIKNAEKFLIEKDSNYNDIVINISKANKDRDNLYSLDKSYIIRATIDRADLFALFNSPIQEIYHEDDIFNEEEIDDIIIEDINYDVTEEEAIDNVALIPEAKEVIAKSHEEILQDAIDSGLGNTELYKMLLAIRTIGIAEEPKTKEELNAKCEEIVSFIDAEMNDKNIKRFSFYEGLYLVNGRLERIKTYNAAKSSFDDIYNRVCSSDRFKGIKTADSLNDLMIGGTLYV